MSALTLHTNNVPRFTIDATDLTAREREEFDYLDWPAIDRQEDSATFVRYKGRLYDLGEVEIATDDVKALGFDGQVVDSFFSAVVFRYFDRDGHTLDDAVVMGRVYS